MATEMQDCFAEVVDIDPAMLPPNTERVVIVMNKSIDDQEAPANLMRVLSQPQLGGSKVSDEAIEFPLGPNCFLGNTSASARRVLDGVAQHEGVNIVWDDDTWCEIMCETFLDYATNR